MICSRIPTEKLPRPSNERGFRPRKSRMRGSAIETSRSRNSHMRAPRSVTRAPTGMPSRSLKLAIDFPARRPCARWPAIVVSSSIALSSCFASVLASPTPMLSVIFCRRGTCITVLSPSSPEGARAAPARRSSSAAARSRCPCALLDSLVDLLAAVGALAHAHVGLAALHFLGRHSDPRRPIACRAHEHHVGDRDRRGLLDHAARSHLRAAHAVGVAHRPRSRVALLDVQVLDDHALLPRARLDHAALLATVLAREHVHGVALADAHLVHQRTSGASETIFMKFFSRSSRATGPKMRVPRGLRAVSISTAAFSSKAIDVPSLRPKGLTVRTTTACTTSPFLTAPCGLALFTVAVITSPTRAYRRLAPPFTRMQRISRAPVLSATRSRDSCWITSPPGALRRDASSSTSRAGASRRCVRGRRPWPSSARRARGTWPSGERPSCSADAPSRCRP